jgi:hypothetical protein
MICGAEACKLGAMIHGAELRVHFLKSFQKRSTCENLSQKGLKNKKVGAKGGARLVSRRNQSNVQVTLPARNHVTNWNDRGVNDDPVGRST